MHFTEYAIALIEQGHFIAATLGRPSEYDMTLGCTICVLTAKERYDRINLNLKFQILNFTNPYLCAIWKTPFLYPASTLTKSGMLPMRYSARRSSARSWPRGSV